MTAFDHVPRAVVPGDVLSAMQKLGLDVVRLDENEAYTHCPVHEAMTGKPDAKPSFSVNLDNGLGYCFSCSYSVNWVQLAADMLNLSRDQATAWTTSQGMIGATERILEQARAEPEDRRRPISRAALALFDPPPEGALAYRKISAEACAAYGVLWDGKTGSWILPIVDPDTHQLLGWQEKRRKRVRNYPVDQVHKSETLFGAHLPVRDALVVVESPLDAVRIFALDYSADSSFGSGISDRQLALIRRRGARRIISFGDNDAAGWKFNRVIVRALRGSGIPVAVVMYHGLPDGADPGDLTDDQLLAQLASARSSLWLRW